MSAERTTTLSVRLTCDECWRDSEVGGRYVRHRDGSVTFVLEDADRQCEWCGRAETAGVPA